MAGNRPGDNSGNILVDFDYNNIIVVDPNKTIDAFGNIAERLVDHENLVMYANLEAEVVPRTKLSVGGSPEDRIRTISVAKMNFLRPTEGTYLSTGYYDELTGKNSINQKGVNQLKEETIIGPNNQAYKKMSPAEEGKTVDSGLLGITSIEVTTNTSFIPSVTILLEDIQGKALFQLGNSSPYAAFFNLPYCPFYLTLKGYYGQAIRYQLNLRTFNASYNSFSGNYQVRLEFVGYKFNILNEISIGNLLAAPHMYSTRYDVSRPTETLELGKNSSTLGVTVSEPTNSQDNVVTQIVSERGYEKIVEVYSEYKAKKLIPEDFPELTVAQLMSKLSNFEKSIIASYPPANVQPLTDIRQYKDVLSAYFNQVRGASNSWFKTYMNPKPIVLVTGEYVYTFKNEYLTPANAQVRVTAKSLLSGQTTNYNNLLASNPVLGKKGLSPIKNSITYYMFTIDIDYESVDFVKTIKEQTGITSPTNEDLVRIQDYVKYILKPVIETTKGTQQDPSKVSIINEPLYIFDGEGGFDKTISQIETEANKKLSEYETAISADLAKKIENSDTGIGFKPSVRNISAVVMASAEGFIRLLDDVHTNAWNVKYDPVRKEVIINNQTAAQGTDTRDNVPVAQTALNNNSNYANSQIPVYPWPQFFVETPDDKKGRFQLKYIGDPSVVGFTKGYSYEKWPEVEFVEEFMRGLTQKFNPPVVQPPTDNGQTTKIININAIEFPSIGLAYANKEEIKFFYEIWERQFLTANYSGFIRANQNQVNQLINLNIEAETNNIVSGLGISSPYITFKLKNYDLNNPRYPLFLKSISNEGTGRAYQEFSRDLFVTPYIKNLTENSFNILSIKDLGKIPQESPSSEALTQLVKNASNTPLVIDTYPFTNPSWVENNMSSSNFSKGELVYDTKNVMTVFDERNVIANFTSVYNKITNRPVTNFSYLNPTTPSLKNIVGLDAFFKGREFNDFVPTEGYVNYISPTLSLSTQTITSILNTPYFINAIQNGVYNWRKNDKYPYIQAAYLFLNSLPLASLRERYKTLNSSSDLDYIASCFKKFGAIHKMPYAWILKLGSVWYRYKTYKEQGVDIIDSAWKNFDYKENFDPITSAETKTYEFTFDGVKQITLQEQTTTNIKIQTGFFPKVINDFNVFYKGYDLYVDYTNSEIQKSVNEGMKVYNFDDSNFNATQNNTTLNFQTWSVILPDNIEDPTTSSEPCEVPPSIAVTGPKYFVVPSFGSVLANQAELNCVSNGATKVDLTNNESMYNGSVRLLWSTPNYGYFDANQVVKPQPDSYVNKILPNTSSQAPFTLLSTDEYSKIEEIFSVFDKSILDKLEQEFLNFCKPIADIDLGPQVQVAIGVSPVDVNAVYKNFQYLFRSLMSVTTKQSTTTNAEYFNSLAENQLGVFSNTIKSFLEYDVLLKYGNPANYKRRIFDSFLSQNLTTPTVVDPIQFDPYVLNTLPGGGTITLEQSKLSYPQQWATLETEVGFSTIQNLIYSDSGSYITDFFIDNNIGFTTQNITLCAPLVKMYATQKLYSPSITSDGFKQTIQSYLQQTANFQNNLLNTLLTQVRLKLPNQDQLPEKTIKSVIDGQQSKVENYEVFKALNDKWIAGSDYKSKTLFEDFLFLDRASRNIGDTIIIDIFALRDAFGDVENNKALNLDMSVFTFLSGMLIKNKFNVMPLPAYVNFYNVQEVDGTTISQNSEGSLKFADNMWGTFLDVDYRKSTPKMVCFYTALPSQYLDLPKGNSRYRDDAFEMRRASDNPLIENPAGKNDYALSNKCVGFNVDLGVRNQNIFYSFNVSMDGGKATSESLQAQLDMVDQANGRNTTTQNVSLYNFYKQRSYTCQVVSMGNALIQPTMYFNLRHVPMFNGPYLITEVKHTVQPGTFQTNFSGIRQGIYDLPAIDNYLQSINQNLLTQIESLLKVKKDSTVSERITEINKAAQIQQTGSNVAAATNSCINGLDKVYLSYGDFITATSTSLNATQLVDAIKAKTSNPRLQVLIYMICYVRTFNKNKFYGYNNNYATIELTKDYYSRSDYFVAKKSACVEVQTLNGKVSKPIAIFESIDKFLDFMISSLLTDVDRIYGDNALGITKYYACYWSNPSVTEEYFDSKEVSEFTQLNETFKKAFTSAADAKLDASATQDLRLSTKNTFTLNIKVKAGVTPVPNNLNTTPSPTPVCPLPTIISFSPLTGVSQTILSIIGNDLELTTGVTINGVTTTELTINASTNLNVIVPKSTTPIPITQPIVLRTKNGNVISSGQFTYNPFQTEPNPPTSVPGVPLNANTQPQQTGPLVMTGLTTYNSNGSSDSLLVTINPNAGLWGILSGQTKWTWEAIKKVEGPNNTIINYPVAEGKFSNDLASYVSSDKQSFSVNRTDILNIIKQSMNDDVEFNQITSVQSEISLNALSPNASTNPNNIIPSVLQSFKFNITI